MQADAFNWSVAIVLSLLVHGLVLMNGGAQMGAKNATLRQAPIITRLSFNKVEERVTPEKPQPVKKKKIEPKPVLKKAVKKKPARKKPIRKKQVAKPIPPVEKTEPVRPPDVQPVRQIASAAQVQGQQVSHSNNGLLQQKRQQYLHELLSHIESFKYYPRAARRRSIEGKVKISFMLRDDGYCEHLTFDGRHSALTNAAQQALESAMPLPVPPKDIELPEIIEFAIEYSLTN